MFDDKKLINFGETHELNAILKKRGKRETAENRTLLKEFGKACKAELGKRVLEHTDFHAFLDKNTKLDKQLEAKK